MKNLNVIFNTQGHGCIFILNHAHLKIFLRLETIRIESPLLLQCAIDILNLVNTFRIIESESINNLIEICEPMIYWALETGQKDKFNQTKKMPKRALDTAKALKNALMPIKGVVF